jgi:hypothetical protein
MKSKKFITLRISERMQKMATESTHQQSTSNHFHQQSTSTTHVSTYIDETVVAVQKKRAIEVLDTQKSEALEQSQQVYDVQKSQINFDSDHKLEMAKASIEAKRLDEIMQIEQHFAQERMQLEQQIQQQKISIEQQALQLEQQAKQQQLAKQQYDQMMKYQHQMSTTSAQLSNNASFAVGSYMRPIGGGMDQSFALPTYSYFPQQQLHTQPAAITPRVRTVTPAVPAKTEA